MTESAARNVPVTGILPPAPRARRVFAAAPCGNQGCSTPLITWMTPFDCITLAMVTVAVLPLASVT